MGGPGGIGDYLSGLLNALKGGAPAPAQGAPGSSAAAGVTPTPQGAPGAFPAPQGGPAPAPAAAPPASPVPGMPPMPKSTFLDNPLLQGALGAYFSAISTPKREGIGGAIGHGGLGGLQGYAAARQAQLTPYLMAATLGKTQAETQRATQEGRLAGVKADTLPGQTEQLNRYRAALERLNNVKADDQAGVDAALKEVRESAAALNKGKLSEVQPEIKKMGAQTAEAQAAASEAPSKIDRNEAAAAASRASASEAPSVIERNLGSAAASRATASEAPSKIDVNKSLAALNDARKTLTAEQAKNLPAMDQATIALKNVQASLDQMKLAGGTPAQQQLAQTNLDKNLHTLYSQSQGLGPELYTKMGGTWGETFEQFKAKWQTANPATKPAAGGGTAGSLPPATVAAMKAAGFTPTGNTYPDGRAEVLDKDGVPHAYGVATGVPSAK